MVSHANVGVRKVLADVFVTFLSNFHLLIAVVAY